MTKGIFKTTDPATMNRTSPTRYYNDGPNHPRTPLAARAEKAYREWFAKTAADVPRWTKPNEAAFAAFKRDRTVARRRVVVGTDHGACLFRPGHEIEASKHRGRAQAVEHARVIADLQAKLEPADVEVASLQERLSQLEEQMLEP